MTEYIKLSRSIGAQAHFNETTWEPERTEEKSIIIQDKYWVPVFVDKEGLNPEIKEMDVDDLAKLECYLVSPIACVFGRDGRLSGEEAMVYMVDDDTAWIDYDLFMQM